MPDIAVGSTESTPDLSGFLMGHRGFRAEFGRLAAAARRPRGDAHAALIDDQIDVVMHLLHHHQTGADISVWPRLVIRQPSAQQALARLEARRAEMYPLFESVADRSRPVSSRANDLLRLHEVLNAHLDHAEREAVPLILEHFTAEEWHLDIDAVVAALDRSKLPLIFGWLGSASTLEQRTVALRAIPRIPRALFHLVWWPAYRKRFVELYGPETTIGPNPTRVLS